MPYRIDLDDATADTFDRLVELGALDVEPTRTGLAAILPDEVGAARVANTLGVDDVRVTPAHGRDGGSVWVLRARPVRVGRLQIVPADGPLSPGALRLVDGTAFGTGLHATTVLCLEALEEELALSQPVALLDVGTGSGVLALAAILAGVPRVAAVDIDTDAVKTAEENARLNGVSSRLQVSHGGPAVVTGAWPLVMANILAAPLIEMAPILTQRVGHRGRLVLSGIRSSLAPEVEHAYLRLGMHRAAPRMRDGWTALTLQASW